MSSHCVTFVSCRETGSNVELVAVLGVVDRLAALDHVKTEVQRVAAEDVAHVVAAHDHHLEAGLVGNPFQAGRAHLA